MSITVKPKEDITGWVMSEHGVPDSRLTVIKQVDDYIFPKSQKRLARWLCECSCNNHNKLITISTKLKNGEIKSCGCLKKERFREQAIGNNYGIKNKKENKHVLLSEYGVLWSTNTNEEIYFDLDRADDVLKYSWHVDAHGYASASIGKKHMKMHVYLGYKNCDHHNRNKLDNRSSNLITCTVRENNRNKSIRSDNTSGVIGVSWNKNKNKWAVRIYPEKTGEKFIGYFTNKEDAIKARLEAEAKYYGEFAPQRHLFEEYGIEIL